MKVMGALLILFVLTIPLTAASITAEEREQLIKHLEMSREAFLMGVNGLNADQLNFRPTPDSWTVLECAEHITIAEENMLKEFQEKFMSVQPQAGVTSATTDAQVLEYGYNRELQKAKAPETYQPAGRWDALDGIIIQFLTTRESTLNLARKTKEDLRGRYLEDFKLDAYQYLLILSAHCQRHAKQIREIKASAEFPQ